MANLRAEIKRAFLQSIFDAVQNDVAQRDFVTGTPTDDIPVISLEDGLKAFQREHFATLHRGLLSLGSAGIGHEVKWSPPEVWKDFDQTTMFSLAQEFREVYNDVVATGSFVSDLAILNAMMADDRMQTVTSLQRDFTMLRWNQGYQRF